MVDSSELDASPSQYGVNNIIDHDVWYDIQNAIGDNNIREKLTKIIKHPYGKVIDQNSVISKDVKIGDGAQIMMSSTINIGTRIGNHCIINTNSSIDHDCKVEDFVHVAPGVAYSRQRSVLSANGYAECAT